MPSGLTSLMVIALLFCLWHASTALGVRLMLAFFAITALTSWGFEEIGVATGLIYGPYHYTSALGPWLGSVPILIPFAWFVMVYPTYILANLVADGWPIGTPGRRGDLVRLALLSALLMTAWDLVLDPILSGPSVGAWVWDQGGPFFGVPLQNYVGWIATTFTVYLLYRSAERRWPPHMDRLVKSTVSPTTWRALPPVRPAEGPSRAAVELAADRNLHGPEMYPAHHP
jgi:putative membrane protein